MNLSTVPIVDPSYPAVTTTLACKATKAWGRWSLPYGTYDEQGVPVCADGRPLNTPPATPHDFPTPSRETLKFDGYTPDPDKVPIPSNCEKNVTRDLRTIGMFCRTPDNKKSQAVDATYMMHICEKKEPIKMHCETSDNKLKEYTIDVARASSSGVYFCGDDGINYGNCGTDFGTKSFMKKQYDNYVRAKCNAHNTGGDGNCLGYGRFELKYNKMIHTIPILYTKGYCQVSDPANDRLTNCKDMFTRT